MKDSLLDFPLAFAERRGIEISGILRLLPKHLAQRLKVLKDKIANQIEQVLHPEPYGELCHDATRAKLSAEKIAERREATRIVANYVDLNRCVGVAWQALQSKLDVIGIDDMAKNRALIASTHEYTKLQSSQDERDKAAHQIMQGSGRRYEKAIEIYQIDINKLKK